MQLGENLGVISTTNGEQNDLLNCPDLSTELILFHNRAIMFHIGVATQHPPLPDPTQLSELGIDFIRQCLTIDPVQRPTALELMQHPWMLDFKEALRNYEEAELANGPLEMPPESPYQSATVARQAAIIQEKEFEAINSLSPSSSSLETPSPGLQEVVTSLNLSDDVEPPPPL